MTLTDSMVPLITDYPATPQAQRCPTCLGVAYPGQLSEMLVSAADGGDALNIRLAALDARLRRLEIALECTREEGAS